MKLVDINAPVIITQVDRSALRHVFSLVHFLALGEIIDLDRVPSFEGFLKIECNEGGGRVGIKPYDGVRCSCRAGLSLGSVDIDSNKNYK